MKNCFTSMAPAGSPLVSTVAKPLRKYLNLLKYRAQMQNMVARRHYVTVRSITINLNASMYRVPAHIQIVTLLAHTRPYKTTSAIDMELLECNFHMITLFPSH